jgi:plasmid maintenance system antidote protein VapI
MIVNKKSVFLEQEDKLEIQALMLKQGIKNFSHLARILGVRPQRICNIMNGDVAMTRNYNDKFIKLGIMVKKI